MPEVQSMQYAVCGEPLKKNIMFLLTRLWTFWSKPPAIRLAASEQSISLSKEKALADLYVGPRFESDISFACVDPFVEASLHFTDGDAEGRHQHGDGGVRDVVGNPSQANHHRLVSYVDHLQIVSCSSPWGGYYYPWKLYIANLTIGIVKRSLKIS